MTSLVSAAASSPGDSTPRAAEKAEHDKRIFELADSKMSEAFFRRMIEKLRTGHSYVLGDYMIALDFLSHFESIGNMFVDEQLDHLARQLCSALDELVAFLEVNFFALTGSGELQQRYLYPALNPDLEGSARPGDDEKYTRHAEKLLAVADNALGAYVLFRRAIKQVLLI